MNKVLNLIALLIILVSCAKIGSPPGGPKDEDAPIVEKSTPGNYSTNYSRKKIVIKFDEYIVLKDQFNEFTISPPLEKKPLPLTKGKAIVVELPASKLDTVTYTLDFGQSIQDNNEGNKLPNFQFVISKQAYIDSFSISGKVLNAFTLKPDKERISVYLHKNLADTAPYKVIPSYLGRTNPEGAFTINHVAPGTYSVFALKDVNNNLLYDLPSEAIAFSNELLILHPDSFKIKEPVVDTIIAKTDSLQYADTLAFVTDSLSHGISDSLSMADSTTIMVYGYSFDLFSFTEKKPYKQYLTDYYRKESEYITIVFNEPLENSISTRLLNPDTVGKWYYPESGLEPDSLVFWLADSNLVNNDSIVVEVTYPFTDSTGATIDFTDTLLFRNKAIDTESKGTKEPGKSRLGRKPKEEIVDTLPKAVPRVTFETNINQGAHDLNLPILITTKAPIENFDEKLYKLVRIEDTLEFPVKSKLTPDSLNFRKFKIDLEYEPSANYKIDFYEGMFVDIYGRTIDSTNVNFTTQRDDYYGKITLKFENISSPVIVQLLGKDAAVVKQKIIYTNEKVTFDYLKPDKYTVKIIADDNDNGIWDTGNLKLKLQAEKVDFYPQEFDVRSNWEVEYTWEVKW